MEERKEIEEELKKFREQAEVAAERATIANDLLRDREKKISDLQADLRKTTLKQLQTRQTNKEKGAKEKDGDLSPVGESLIVRPPAVQTPMTGQYPLIIDQGGARYVPWQNQDLEGLVKTYLVYTRGQLNGLGS